MKQEDVIRMAKKAGIAKHGLGWTCWEGQLEAFAKLVAQEVRDRIVFGSRDDWVLAEREACAKLCEAYVAPFIGKELATAIRARGEQAQSVVNQQLTTEQEPVAHQCKGIPRKGCNYLAACDSPCNKCGEIHHHHQMVASFYSLTSPPQRQLDQFVDTTKMVAQEREPDGHFLDTTYCDTLGQVHVYQDFFKGQPFYASPPQRQPLTIEQIDELSRTMVKGNKSVNWLCRAIEAAHGIKRKA